MSTRRSFLIKAPIGLAAAVTACSSKGEAAAGVTLAGGAQAPQGGSAPTPLMPIPANAPVLEYIPKHEELTYTFGGVPAVRRIKPGTRIVSWTEDCFDGDVKTAADLPSKVMTPGHDNPQTGPFFMEGAEPGDTVSVHISTTNTDPWTFRI